MSRQAEKRRSRHLRNLRRKNVLIAAGLSAATVRGASCIPLAAVRGAYHLGSANFFGSALPATEKGMRA